ncbi:hypothetical protein POM88_016523 [Heracleum sosnowskyi]|uniref:Uncharacterized protein n=1 Tax=Heracleum sosnowskyi TaxID=360622 RepID=A0AAD8IQS0_9APIA|nr:hypothetical protein POM88_016523 [Heracleum sosnowskyi]
MDYYNSRYQDEENEEQDDDTISLTHFPLTPDQQEHPSPPEKIDVFEFSSDPNSIMSHAEDIINCGKLIPFKEQDQSPTFHQPQCQTSPVMYVNDHASQGLYNRRTRSESLTELKISECRSNSTNMRGIKMRNSRSLDYQKLSRNSSLSSESPDIYRNNSRGSSRFDASTIKIPKPRWYIFMFGSVKFPPEMDLQDIKNRQVHRTTISKSLFPNLEVVKKPPANRKRSWGVLKVLSCRDDGSVNVTASLACVPRV